MSEKKENDDLEEELKVILFLLTIYCNNCVSLKRQLFYN